MMKLLAFAASNSKKSINKQLAAYAGSLIESAELEVLDINDYEMPIYSADRETEAGIPQLAHDFRQKIAEADAIIIAFAEHNGSYSAAYKNLFDWTSRIDTKVFQAKPMLYLATSPGPGGAKNVLAAASNSAPHFGAELKAQLSIPSFYDNFDSKAGRLSNSELDAQLHTATAALVSA